VELVESLGSLESLSSFAEVVKLVESLGSLWRGHETSKETLTLKVNVFFFCFQN
jgi:hypothetical protein